MTISTSPQYTLRAADFEPAYLALHRQGELQRRAEAAVAGLKACYVCPRDCGVNRLADKTAACKTGRYAQVASYFPHFGEEDCLRGWRGSGTIFFGMCNLRCVFCFHPDTLIATSDGLTRIADLFEQGTKEVTRHGGQIRLMDKGLKVATRQGRWAFVSKSFRHHFSGELIKLKPFNCPPLLLTPTHQVFAVLKTNPQEIIKVQADHLTKDYHLLIPKRSPLKQKVWLNLFEILPSEGQRFRKGRSGRPSREALISLFEQELTSYELAEIIGYHPAYIRKLRGEWRRGVLSSDEELRWAKNDLVEEDARIRFKTEQRPGIPAQMVLDERLAWLLGFYCAEGHVTAQKDRPNSYRLIFSSGHQEKELAHRVQDLLQDLFDVKAELRWRRTTVTVEIGKASLALMFAQLCGKGAREKQVPSLLLQAPAEVLQAFLQGVLAGDGCERDTHLVINTVSKKLAMGLFEIGLLLGILPSFHEWHPSPTKAIEGRQVNQSTLCYVKFPKVNPKTGKRHYRWKEGEDCFFVPIHKIERMPYEGPVFNLEIDEADHSYLAPFVAVSNCQNYDISQADKSLEVSPAELAGMMLELQEQGCHNINFVTPEHVVPQILEALPLAVEAGLRLPIVYNTSAYDSMESLRLLDGIVDIYMPDFKFWTPELSLRYLKAKDYAQAAGRAIKEMVRQVGPLRFDEKGLAKRGVLLRHLVMPGLLDETRHIFEFLAREIGPELYVNVMDQYYPAGKVNPTKYAEINRGLTPPELQEALRLARAAGFRLDERRGWGWWR